MSAPPLPVPDRITPIPQELFSQIEGGSLICAMVMWFLYGVATLQTYMYFLNCEKDTLFLKGTVFVVWALATVHSVFIGHSTYHYEILSYSNPILVVQGEWSVYAGTVVSALLCIIVQLFFARMLFHLTRKTLRVILTSFLAVLILAETAFSALLCAKLFILWDLLALKNAVYIAMVPTFALRVVVDATTSSALCILLYNTRTDFGRSINLINTLIKYAVNRFVLTTMVVVIQTIILITHPDAVWAMVIEFITSGLYVNSFLATLNSRQHLRRMDGTALHWSTQTTQTTKGATAIAVTTSQSRNTDYAYDTPFGTKNGKLSQTNAMELGTFERMEK